jgi:hypothetical protein
MIETRQEVLPWDMVDNSITLCKAPSGWFFALRHSAQATSAWMKAIRLLLPISSHTTKRYDTVATSGFGSP